MLEPLGFDDGSPCADHPLAAVNAAALVALGAPHAESTAEDGTASSYWQFDVDGVVMAIQLDEGADEGVIFLDAPALDEALEALLRACEAGGISIEVTWRLDQPDPNRLREAFPLLTKEESELSRLANAIEKL